MRCGVHRDQSSPLIVHVLAMRGFRCCCTRVTLALTIAELHEYNRAFASSESNDRQWKFVSVANRLPQRGFAYNETGCGHCVQILLMESYLLEMWEMSEGRPEKSVHRKVAILGN